MENQHDASPPKTLEEYLEFINPPPKPKELCALCRKSLKTGPNREIVTYPIKVRNPEDQKLLVLECCPECQVNPPQWIREIRVTEKERRKE